MKKCKFKNVWIPFIEMPAHWKFNQLFIFNRHKKRVSQHNISCEKTSVPKVVLISEDITGAKSGMVH